MSDIGKVSVELETISLKSGGFNSLGGSEPTRVATGAYTIKAVGMSPIALSVSCEIASDDKDVVQKLDARLHQVSHAMHDAIKQRAGVL